MEQNFRGLRSSKTQWSSAKRDDHRQRLSKTLQKGEHCYHRVALLCQAAGGLQAFAG